MGSGSRHRRSAGEGCGEPRTDVYEPRHPEDSILYQVVQWKLETFLARQRHDGRPVPSFVEQELRAFLDCGIPARGLLHLRCETCGADRLVAFSCKTRSFCPSCCGRRMADTSAHLVERVFPRVPVRQWVLSVPHRLRYLLAFDPDLVTAVYQVFARAVFGTLRRRARKLGLVSSSVRTQCGAVTLIQRAGSAGNLHVHYHMICIDGVYALPGPLAAPVFVPLEAPPDAEVVLLTETIGRRITALLKRKQLGLDEGGADGEDLDPVRRNEPYLADVYAASILGRVSTGVRKGQRLKTGSDRVDPENLESLSGPRCSTVDGFSLHANVAVPASDRQRLNSLLRYVTRPPLASERLEGLEDGRVVYHFKRPWRDGTDHAVFEPEDFTARLAAMVPKPRAHLIRFSGILAPAARWRTAIVPGYGSAAAPVPHVDAENGPGQRGSESGAMIKPTRRRNYSWSDLMKRTFSWDVLACKRCGGRLKLVAAISASETARKILDCMGLPSRPPPLAPARLDQQDLDFR